MAGTSEDTYVGGAAAVLVACVESPGDGVPDGLEGLLATLIAVVREADGEAERLGSSAIMAGFATLGSCVQAALEIHRRLAGDDRVQGRVGVLALDTVLSTEGEALATAVATAERLAAAARPGTLVVSARARDALPADLAANAERIDVHGLHAYLLAPSPAGPPVTRRSVLSGIAGAAALGAAGAAVVLSLRRREPSAAEQRLALGVLRFKAPGVAEGDLWIRDAVRDGLNTQLSELVGLRVYSREFIDFLMTRQNLSEIEVATKLGIQKMLSGSVTIADGTVHVDTQVVDVASGVIDSSVTRAGPRTDYLSLQHEVIVGVIETLGLHLSAEDERRLAARRATDVEALRHLLEVEGGKPALSRPGTPPGPNGSSWFGPRAAFAAEDEPVQPDIVAFLDRYRRATEAGDVAALASMYTEFPAEQRAALERYFAGVRNLRVTIDNREVAVVGHEAVVSYSRTDDFVDARTGRPMHVTVRVTKTLGRADGGWVFAAAK